MNKIEDNLLQLPASLNSYRPLKDNSFNLTFQTQELTTEQKMLIIQLHQDFGHLLFKINPIQMNEVPDDPANLPANQKSPSQQLKNTIYALYQAQNAPYGMSGFDRYYREKMARFKQELINEISEIKNQ